MPDIVPEEDQDIRISGKEDTGTVGRREETEDSETIRKSDETENSETVRESERTEDSETVSESEGTESTENAETNGNIESTADGETAEISESFVNGETAEILENSVSDEKIETTDENIIDETSDSYINTVSDDKPEYTEGSRRLTDTEEAGASEIVANTEEAGAFERLDDTEEAGISKIVADTGYPDDDFSEEFFEIEHEQQDFEIMEEIGDSIIKQVDGWTGIQKEDSGNMESDNPDDENNTENSDAKGSDEAEDNEKGLNPFLAFLRRIPKWGYAVIGSALVLTFFLMWLTMSAAGQSLLVKLGSKWIAGKFTYQPVTDVTEIEYLPEKDTDNGADPNEITGIPDVPDNYEVVTPDITEEPTPIPEEKNVYNILLIGEENIDSGSSRGRSDLIMIASINKEQRKVKLISILRDILVAIPNHSDNRINAAYTIGGVSLLYDTLKANLGVEFDNYCLVNFDSFENIVDAIGGIDVSLTAEEAAYLNKTNYISKPEYRNVIAGMNHFNGNQALGYCRIRKVPTEDMLYSDTGRTSRQRRLMRQIFEQFNKMSNVEMMGFVNKCTPYLTTDLTSEQLEQFILMLTEMSPVGFEEMRLPVEGSFYDAKLRGMLVTQIDLSVNSEALHKFIFGE